MVVGAALCGPTRRAPPRLDLSPARAENGGDEAPHLPGPRGRDRPHPARAGRAGGRPRWTWWPWPASSAASARPPTRRCARRSTRSWSELQDAGPRGGHPGRGTSATPTASSCSWAGERNARPRVLHRRPAPAGRPHGAAGRRTRVARLTLPYLREKPASTWATGSSSTARWRATSARCCACIDECIASGRPAAPPARARPARERCWRSSSTGEVWTAFQPIVEMESRRVMGLRGPLARPAGQRAGSRRSSSSAWPPATAWSRSWSAPAGARPSWTGRPSARPGACSSTPCPPPCATRASWAGACSTTSAPSLSPRLVTLEINERQVIENLSLYREAMHPSWTSASPSPSTTWAPATRAWRPWPAWAPAT